MPKVEFTKIVRNKSSRGGVKPSLIVLHTTESHDRPGLSDLQGLASWFNNAAAQASSHIGNDQEGNSARFVYDGDKSWTQARYNPQSLSIEQIAFARYSKDTWMRHRHKQLSDTASWVAEWSRKHGIPVRKGRTYAGRVLLSGVVQHSDLGTPGGGHHDCGAGYPIRYVRILAEYRVLRAGGKHNGLRGKSLLRRINRERKKYGVK